MDNCPDGAIWWPTVLLLQVKPGSRLPKAPSSVSLEALAAGIH